MQVVSGPSDLIEAYSKPVEPNQHFRSRFWRQFILKRKHTGFEIVKLGRNSVLKVFQSSRLLGDVVMCPQDFLQAVIYVSAR